MEYTYYKSVKSNEHMLYASEIADMCGILSVANMPASRLITAILNRYIEKHNIKHEQLYYLTRSGFMTKVYPKDIYENAIIDFSKELAKELGDDFLDKQETLKATIYDRTYVFKIRRKSTTEDENKKQSNTISY